MKKSFIISVVLVSLFATSSYFAQGKISQGIYKVGGSIQFSSGSHEDDYTDETNTVFNFAPSYSYLVTNNLEVGGTINYQYYETNSESKNIQYGQKYKNISRNYGIGPRVCYYFNTGKFFPFIGGSCHYYTNKLSGDNKSEYRNYNAFIGAEIFLSSSVAVEPLVQYGITDYGQNDYKTFSVGVGINYFIVD